MVADSAGNIYGTTRAGGIENTKCFYGSCGTVFKIAPDGTESVIARFGGRRGELPLGGLIADRQFGHLYGTTSEGTGKVQFGQVLTVMP